jgi:hypothetical protein
VHEYLIRAEDHDSLAPERDSLPALRLVAGEGWAECDGWGDFRIKRGDVEVSFSFEDPGAQIAVEGPIERAEADALVERLALHLTQSEGRQTYVVPLS